MSLQEKVLRLKLEAVAAARHAAFWEKQLNTYGEAKATAFYKHLGLNHIERKGYEWEGLTLSREPTEAEKICVKGIAQAQDTAKEQVVSILLRTRSALIDQGLAAIADLSPSDYHTLVLTVPTNLNSELRAQAQKVFKVGRSLIAAQFGKKEAQLNDDDLDEYADLTDARVTNDVQARIIAARARFRLLGLEGEALDQAVRNEIQAGTVTYIDRTATGLANLLINAGRAAEADEHSDEIDRVEYSALLDQNVCGPCAAEDGTTAANEADLQPAPNPECEGGDWCRCFHIFVNQ